MYEFVIFILLSAWHLIADQQTNAMSKSKAYSIKACICHVCLYSIIYSPIAAGILVFGMGWGLWQISMFLLINIGTHLIIDWYIYSIYRKLWENDLKKLYRPWLVILDQCLHMPILLFSFYWLI